MDIREKLIYDTIERLSKKGLIAHSAHRPAERDDPLTNLPAHRRPIVKRAIEETGSPIYIKDIATDVRDRVMPGHISVWAVAGHGNLEIFWDAYDRLVHESKFEEDKRW